MDTIKVKRLVRHTNVPPLTKERTTMSDLLALEQDLADAKRELELAEQAEQKLEDEQDELTDRLEAAEAETNKASERVQAAKAKLLDARCKTEVVYFMTPKTRFGCAVYKCDRGTWYTLAGKRDDCVWRELKAKPDRLGSEYDYEHILAVAGQISK